MAILGVGGGQWKSLRKEKLAKEGQMKGHLFEKKERFSMRKFSVEYAPRGLAFLGTGAVSADETYFYW